LFALAVASACGGEERYHDKPLEYWVAALRSSDAAIRAEAVDVIAEASPRTKETVDLLLNALSAESDTSLHPKFAQALGRLGSAAAPAVPQLATLLRDDHIEIREAAAIALGNIGPAAASAVPDLTRALRDCCHDVRAEAAVALGRIGQPAIDAVPALIEAMNDPISWVRLQSVEALVTLQPRTQAVISAYTRALADTREEVRAAAAIGLSKTGASTSSALSSLARLLSTDPYPAVRIAAATALGALAPASRSELQVLMTAQSDSNFAVRAAVRDAIAMVRAGS
jgi:HEAT repeat protein